MPLLPSPLTLLNDEEEAFFQAAKTFARKEIAPLVTSMDEAQVMSPELIRKIFQMGFMGIDIPEQWGGSGGTFFQSILAVQAFAQVDASVSVFIDVQNTLANNALMRFGSDALKKTYLPKMAQDTICSYALSEAHSGSDAFALTTSAAQSGDHYVLSGRKIFITSAKEAELFILFANANPAAGYKGITAFVIEKSTPGLTIGRQESKMGIRASSTCEVVLDAVRVPQSHVLGQVGQGYKIAIETLNDGRIGIAAQMVGLAEGAFAQAVRYVKTREQFGQVVADFQGVKFQLAQMAVSIETARLLVYNAARLKAAAAPYVKEAAMAKLHASEVAERVASLSLELHGGYGFVKDYPAEKYYRDAKVGKIYEGTSNIQLQTIAKYILSDH